MYVWELKCHDGCDSVDTLGIFDSEEKAKEALLKIKRDPRYTTSRTHFYCGKARTLNKIDDELLDYMF